MAHAEDAARVGLLEIPPQDRPGRRMRVFEQHGRFEAQDRAGHDRLAVRSAREHELAADAQVDGDVGVEGEPPLGEALR